MVNNLVFDPKSFANIQIKEIRKALGKEKVIIACSGGVDSTTCAVLTHKAVEKNLICVFIDTGFMRLKEPDEVVKTLSDLSLNLPIKLIRAEDRFLKAIEGYRDAEEKRKIFRNTFYSILSEAAREENCQFLVQGTILPDIIETTKGIKTQHNVLEQMKINTKEVYGFKVIEPLSTLYKYQVREVAKYLGIPLETSERQPFPGPGLSVRVVGEITREKLDVEKIATEIVEEKFEEVRPKQYFAAIINDEKVTYLKTSEVERSLRTLVMGETKIRIQSLRDRATGIKAGMRQYGKVVLADVKNGDGKCVELPMKTFNEIQRKIIEVDDEVTRVLYRITDAKRNGRWIIAIRAVETHDFITATISNVPWKILKETSRLIMDSCPTVSTVYFDVTPKPPSSIEFE